MSFGGLFGGIGKVAWAHGAQFSMVYVNSDDDFDHFLDSTLEEKEFDGLLLRPEVTVAARHIDLLEQRTLPYVIVRTHAVDRDSNFVAPADEEEAYLATRHLLALGHTRIAVLIGGRESPVFADRFRGYLRALSESGLEYDDTLVRESDSFQSGEPKGEDVITELLRGKNPPTAVLIGASPLLPWAYRAIEEAGLRIPDDISIVGSDEELIGADLTPELTRFGANHYHLGVQALETLIGMIETGLPSRVQIVNPPCLHLAASTAAPPSVPVASPRSLT
ncbi:MAG: substrate-binding domain-containing protein [Chloroflexota bacterium]